MQTLVNIFGIFGNIVAFLVFLAPAPTFRRILKRKTTEEFQSLPYMLSLISSMLWIYYAILKTNETLLITINSIGSLMEAIYISIYITYASKTHRITAVKVLVVLNIVGFGLILVLTQFIVKENGVRVHVLGWISVALTATVYFSPLCIMRQVVRTKSVEFMPITLTFTLLLNAVMWFFYGLLLNDFYVLAPNVLGFIFAAAQIIVYLVYKNHKGGGDQNMLPITSHEEPKTTSVSDQMHPTKSTLPNQNLEIVAKQNGGGEVTVRPTNFTVGDRGSTQPKFHN